MPQAIPLVQVDAFTDRPFAGNPAAVCVTPHALDEATMQAIAAEMNLSETAFAVPEGADRYHLRWFTPACEVPLCGHATLATARVLFEQAPVAEIAFRTLGGDLTVRRDGDRIRMDFPADATDPAATPERLPAALGTIPREVRVSRRMRMLVAILEDASAVRAVRPDFRRLRAVEEEDGFDGCIVTAPGADGFDFVSRFFAPSVGIDEDPVTGSAHTVLGPLWGERLGRAALRGFQASARGGVVGVELGRPPERSEGGTSREAGGKNGVGSASPPLSEIHGDRVHLIGQAVIVMEGRLLLA